MSIAIGKTCPLIESSKPPSNGPSLPISRYASGVFDSDQTGLRADQAGAHVDCFPAHAAFPKWPEGRHPHCHFRGLLRLHSRYSSSDRSVTKATFVTRLRPCQLPGQTARQLPDQSTTLWVESSSTDGSRLRGARPKSDIARFIRSLDPHGRELAGIR
jgi:hypothetical protein